MVNGGGSIPDQMYYPLTQVDLPTPTRADHTFAGWYTNPAFLGQPITSVVMDRDRTVYAKWEEVVYYDKLRVIIQPYNSSEKRLEIMAHQPYYLTQVDDRGQVIKKTDYKVDGFRDVHETRWYDQVEVPRGKYILLADDGTTLGNIDTANVNNQILIETSEDKWAFLYYNAVVYEKKPAYSVLYQNRLLVINEPIEDRAANIANYGYVVREMSALTAENNWYPEWNEEGWEDYHLNNRIKKVKFGSPIKPKHMNDWFNCCRNMVEINPTGLDTSEVEEMVGTFQSCTVFPGCDITGWGTTALKNMNGTFSGCKAWLDSCEQVSTWDTSAVTNFAGTFMGLGVETIKFDIDTSAATTMSSMYGYQSVAKVIDMTSHDSHNVMDFPHMFTSCHSVETIIATDDFVIPAGANTPNMFLQCYALVGGNGTAWNGSKITGEMAHIDTAENPGYFTRG